MWKYEKFLQPVRVIVEASIEISRKVRFAFERVLLFQIPRYGRWGLYTQLVIISVCWMTWKVFYFELAPGDAIAALALVAVIMTVRANSFTKAEQVVWVLIGFSLFACETTIIHGDRVKNDLQQRIELTQQNIEFGETLQSFRDIHGQNKNQLKKTDSLLRDTDKNLLNITGGDDFGYVLPSENSLEGEGFSVRLYHDGNEQLTGVSVRIAAILHDCPWPPQEDQKCTEQFDAGFLTPFQMGTLGPSTSMLIPHMLVPHVDGDGISHYAIQIAAQNGIAIEQIWFRRARNNHAAWAYKYVVYREVHGKTKKGDFSAEGHKFRPLKKADWREPLTQP